MKRPPIAATLGLAAVAITGALGAACTGLYSGTLEGASFRFPIAATTLEGQGPIGGLLSALGVVFPFDQVIPSRILADRSVTEVQLDSIAIRIATAADYDAQQRLIPARQKDGDLVGRCTGAPPQNLDFLRSVDLFIQKDGSLEKTRIAHYCNSTAAADCAAADRPAAVATDVCGFFFTVDLDPATGEPHDLLRFLPDYTITTTARGTAPVEDVTLTGYVGVDWLAPTVDLPR
jgi:hypothetical protein